MNTPYEKHDPDCPLPSAPVQVTIPEAHAVEQQSFYIKTVKRRPLHKIILLFNFIIMCSSFNLALGQIFGLFLKELVVRETLMRCYIIAISSLVVCNELEWSNVLRDSAILQKYTWRGLFYTFIATVGDTGNDIGDDRGDTNYSYTNEDGYVVIAVPTFETFAEVFIKIASLSLFIGGVLYFLMGLMFLQGKVEKDVEEYHRRLNIANAAHTNKITNTAKKVYVNA